MLCNPSGEEACGGSSAAARAVTRPLLRYYGGAWSRALWTIEHFPEHTIYAEPFMGSAAVLLRKPPAKLEIAGDIDGRVMCFFRVLRERPAQLVEALRLTPWHEGEYRLCLEPATDELEEARRLFFSSWASVRGGPAPGRSDFRWQKTQTRRSAAVRDIAELEHLYAAAERLRNVQFLQRDGLELVAKMRGTGALLYCDPPYVPETRTRQNGYRHEPGREWHRDLAALLLQHEGPVVLAGYASGLYEELYEARSWARLERRQSTNSGGHATECLWLSPETQRLLAASGPARSYLTERQKDRKTEIQKDGPAPGPATMARLL